MFLLRPVYLAQLNLIQLAGLAVVIHAVERSQVETVLYCDDLGGIVDLVRFVNDGGLGFYANLLLLLNPVVRKARHDDKVAGRHLLWRLVEMLHFLGRLPVFALVLLLLSLLPLLL